jgi:hypothetical protein
MLIMMEHNRIFNLQIENSNKNIKRDIALVVQRQLFRDILGKNTFEAERGREFARDSVVNSNLNIQQS